MNVELVREVQELILKYPRNIDMQDVERETQYCGSVGCLIFWTCLARGKEADWDMAARLLELGRPPDYGPAYRLFLPASWPEPWKAKLELARFDTREAYAQVVADYLDYFVETFHRS